MKTITPYKTIGGAMRALDNGGRFYNIFTQADDGEITQSEISKAAGVISGSDNAALFFLLAISRLSDAEQKTLIEHLSGKIQERIQEDPPQWVPVYRFHQSAEINQPVLIEGYPFYIEDKTQLQSYITIPITTNNVTTMMMIPIYEQFDIYDVYGNPDRTGRNAIVAVTKTKGSKRLNPSLTSFAGVIKEMEFKSKKNKKRFLETSYLAKQS